MVISCKIALPLPLPPIADPILLRTSARTVCNDPDMASSTSKVVMLLLAALFIAAGVDGKGVVAPGPAPAWENITAIFDKGGQYSTFIRLLKETQVGEQIQNQLKNSYEGLTILAPTDNAFNNLKAGTLNTLDPQKQVALVLYHVLPRFYSLSTFETASNPVSTQASDRNGVYTLNITSTTNQVNISTGVDDTPVNNVLYSDFPLSVYSVDKVLLPYDIFGPKPPAAAPEPASENPTKKKTPADLGLAPSSEADSSSDSTSSRPNAAPPRPLLHPNVVVWAVLFLLLPSVPASLMFA